MARKPGFLSELKRRRVIRTAAMYAVVAFIVAQAADLLLPALLLPEWAFRMVVALLILGFPVAVALAWSFDLTSEGIRRTGSPERGDPPGEQPRERGEDEDDAAPAGTASRSSMGSRRFAVWMGLAILFAGAALLGYHSLGPSSEAEEAGYALPSATEHSIAVLPLTNLSGGEENEYFADGMTEDILTNLGLVPDFSVTSRTSVMRYKGSDQGIREIADELGVRYVLEGSLRRDEDRMRIVMQLVEPDTDRQIWAQTLDRRMDDVFELQSDVAQAVVDALRVELTGGLEERMGRAPTEDLEAYQLFLRGRDAYYRYTPSDNDRAMELFGEAVERDPEFALGHAWLGASAAVAVVNFRADPGLLEVAEEAARRAVELQPDLGDGHRALGTTLAVQGRYEEAAPALERAIELNPHDFPAIGNLGLTHALEGQWDRAIELVLISTRRDPARSPIDYANLTGYLAILSLFEEATEAGRQALALGSGEDPTILQSLGVLEVLRDHPSEAVEIATGMTGPEASTAGLDGGGRILALAGEHDAAREVLERAHAAAPRAPPIDFHPPSVLLAHYLAREGETARAEEILREVEDRLTAAIELGHENPAFHLSLAGAAAIRGERTAALDHLEAAVERGWNSPHMTRLDPTLSPLHDEPRFAHAMARMQDRVEAMRQRVLEVL